MLNLTDCVEAYEQSIANGFDCAIELFAPHESHPEYAEIVTELVRVEMEHRGWQPRSNIAGYCKRFPVAFDNPVHRAIIAFEEFRVRRQHGEPVTRHAYADEFQIDTTQWPSIASNPDIDLLADAGSSGHRGRLVPSVTEMDETHLLQCIAEAFPEFEPLEELGRGAFGRVFLARQRNLADRLVVIKITSDTTTEPERLARLQHTNIVPVYSVHRTADWQAICMPFFGRRTLRDHPVADIQSSLRLMEQVAIGLQHAHRCGILHRDVKPANILVTDNGQPMLLDFNLSSDSASRSMTRSIVGGTIPYLSPEQLQSLRSGESVSATADIYSIGVILFELLAGRLPFELPKAASIPELIQHAQERESGEIPHIRSINPRVSFAVQDIVLKCLQPESADRYQSAADLAADLRRELDRLPLKHAPNSSIAERIAKWRHRHPRLLSVTTLAAALLAMVIIAGMGSYASQRRMLALHAESQWKEFQLSAPEIRTLLSAPDASLPALTEGISSAKNLVNQYHVADSADWHHRHEVQLIEHPQRQLLDEELSEIVFLMAYGLQRQSRFCTNEMHQSQLLNEALQWNSLASQFDCAADSGEVWLSQRSAIQQTLNSLSSHAAPQVDLQFRARPIADGPGQLSGFSNAIRLLEAGDSPAAHVLLSELVQRNPHDYSVWYLLGKSRQAMRLYGDADAAFSTCIALNADCWVAWQDRAVVRLELQRFEDAAADCTNAIHLRPSAPSGYLNRALANAALKEFQMAEADLNMAIQSGGPSRAFFLRADVRQQQGNQAGAQSDYDAGLKAVPNDVDSWVTRGMAYLPQDPVKALADFEQALRLDPKSRDALQNSAHVLAERLGKREEAIRFLDTLLTFCPDDNPARIGRAVLYARAGEDALARRDADDVLQQSPDAITRYQVACVFALTSPRSMEDTERAMRHLSEAMRASPELHSMAEQDSDLNPLRNLPAFQELLNACRKLMTLGTDVPSASKQPIAVNQSNGD
ncbi:MAG: protein kinase [Planctomycetaceae bacterium]|nr:protein kinase [Planctomycetaceae bacterium]